MKELVVVGALVATGGCLVDRTAADSAGGEGGGDSTSGQPPDPTSASGPTSASASGPTSASASASDSGPGTTSASSGSATSATASTSSDDGDPDTTGADADDGDPPKFDLPPSDCPPDPDEFNDTPATATPLPSDWMLHSGFLCKGYDNVDFYQFTLPHGGVADASLWLDPGTYEVQVTLYAPDAATILDQTTGEGGAWHYLLAESLGPGTYFIEVLWISFGDLGYDASYTISLFADCFNAPCDKTDLEPPPDADCQVVLEWALPEPEVAMLVAPQCEQVPRQVSCGASDGWVYPATVNSDPPHLDYTRLQLCGSWCDDFRTGTPLELWAYCYP